MKTICVAARKGGCGKTTLARNLAVAAAQEGLRVLVIDLDPQQTLRAWWQDRESDAPMMLSVDPPPLALGTTLQAAREHFDLVVIDTPPAVPVWIADVLDLADLALVPVRPSPDDLRAVGATLCDMRDAGVPFCFVVSQAEPGKMTEDAARALALLGRVAPARMTRSGVYAEVAATGQGVTETSDKSAAAEIAAIWASVRRLIA